MFDAQEPIGRRVTVSFQYHAGAFRLRAAASRPCAVAPDSIAVLRRLLAVQSKIATVAIQLVAV